MAIKKDQGDLPKASAKAAEDVWMPVDLPMFAGAIEEYMVEQDPERAPKSRHYVRPSDALKCARRIGYTTAGVEPTNPPDAGSLLAFAMGNYTESICQAAVTAKFPGAEHQVPIDKTITIDGVEIPVIGYIDLMLDDRIVDYKSVGGWGFKAKTGHGKQAEGPDMGNVIQTAIYALLMGKQRVGVAYVSKEALSAAIAAKAGLSGVRKLYCEFWADIEDVRDVAEKELLRQWAIVELVWDEEVLPQRKIPGIPGYITDPEKGTWVAKAYNAELEEDMITDTGSTWHCSYCDYQDRCISDGPGRVAVHVRRNDSVDEDPGASGEEV